jgi:hypothetical protein
MKLSNLETLCAVNTCLLGWVALLSLLVAWLVDVPADILLQHSLLEMIAREPRFIVAAAVTALVLGSVLALASLEVRPDVVIAVCATFIAAVAVVASMQSLELAVSILADFMWLLAVAFFAVLALWGCVEAWWRLFPKPKNRNNRSRVG